MTNEEILKWFDHDPYIQSLFRAFFKERDRIREMVRQGQDYRYSVNLFKDLIDQRNADLKVADIENRIPSDVIEEMRNEIFTIFEQE